VTGLLGGPFEFQINVPIADSADARMDLVGLLTPDDRDSTPLIIAGSVDDTWNLMCQYARQMEASGLAYSLFNMNSNTFVAALIDAAGRDPFGSLPTDVLPSEVVGYNSFQQIIDLVPPPIDGP